MRKTVILILLLIVLPLTAWANDYAWTASHMIRSEYGEACPVIIVTHGTEKGFRLGLPRLGWSYTDFSSVSTGDFVLMDEFAVGSHATGASGPLGKAISRTYGVTLSGADKAHLEGIRDVVMFTRTLKVEIPASTMLTGPDEGSPCNSRTYYVRVYGQTETISCTAKPWLSSETQKLTVRQVEPIVWVLYAVDTYIPPLEDLP